MGEKEYISWLLSITQRCLGDKVRGIVSNSIRYCMKRWSSCSKINVDYGDTQLFLKIPCSQMPEAWANFLHVFCLDDYMLYRISDLIRPGATIVDVGAFLGFFTLRVGLMMKRQGLIISVEPNPLAREVLYENLLMNRFEKISRVDPRLICGKKGQRELLITEYWALSSINMEYVKMMNENLLKTLRLPCITLRELLFSHKIGKVDLLKLDIEGGEVEVIEKGLIDRVLQRQTIRSMIIELHLLPKSVEKILYNLKRLLHEAGYEVLEINPLSSLTQVIALIR